MSLTPADRLFIGRFLLLFVATLVVALLGTFKAPLPALGDKNSHQQAYLFQQAKVLFSNDPTLSAGDVLSLNAKKTVVLPDSWDTTQPSFEGQGWYQIDFRLDPDKPVPNAVFMPIHSCD